MHSELWIHEHLRSGTFIPVRMSGLAGWEFLGERPRMCTGPNRNTWLTGPPGLPHRNRVGTRGMEVEGTGTSSREALHYKPRLHATTNSPALQAAATCNY